jgi:hypothetical protein
VVGGQLGHRLLVQRADVVELGARLLGPSGHRAVALGLGGGHRLGALARDLGQRRVVALAGGLQRVLVLGQRRRQLGGALAGQLGQRGVVAGAQLGQRGLGALALGRDRGVERGGVLRGPGGLPRVVLGGRDRDRAGVLGGGLGLHREQRGLALLGRGVLGGGQRLRGVGLGGGKRLGGLGAGGGQRLLGLGLGALARGGVLALELGQRRLLRRREVGDGGLGVAARRGGLGQLGARGLGVGRELAQPRLERGDALARLERGLLGGLDPLAVAEQPRLHLEVLGVDRGLGVLQLPGLLARVEQLALLVRELVAQPQQLLVLGREALAQAQELALAADRLGHRLGGLGLLELGAQPLVVALEQVQLLQRLAIVEA